MTYNILTNLMDGQKEGSYTVANWSNARRDGAAKLILNAAPDLIAIQEGSAWVGSPQGRGGTRMVDSLVSALGGHYGLATTEIPPSQPNYYRTGDYILYNKSTFKSIGDSTSNHWTIGTPGGKAWFGVYDTLQQLSTGARIFFVGTHLATGSGSTADTERENETKALISDATNADTSGYPIVYAGDMNSHPYPGHVDGPGVAMSQAGIPDAEAEAQAFTNHQYNSANQYLNPPPATQDNIDHVFVPSGSGVSSWKLVLDLVSGKLRTPIPSDHNPLVATIQLPY
jgi:endonuclease/exonuclease/phosphatase family metal-dependent hydrolase